MIDDFIRDTLAHIDDLTELKVSLVALRLLELRQSEVASVTRQELAEHGALKHGLGIVPDIALEAALQRAVARGTLLMTTAINPQHPRYFANTDASRAAVDALEATMSADRAARRTTTDAVAGALALVAREIERLECIEAYPVSEADAALVREWLARGYTTEEIAQLVRDALGVPRRKSAPRRSLESCAEAVSQTAPIAPSPYYQTIIAHAKPPIDEVIAFREQAHRWPAGHEFEVIRTAAGLFGGRATVQALKRIVNRDHADVSGLIALLAEEEEAQLAHLREQMAPDQLRRQVIQLYETAFGLPPTSYVANDISSLAGEITDLAVWQGVFQYAAHQNKRDWGYIRKILLNPSPSIYLPQPVNEAAQFAFAEYRRRVGKGVLPATVAEDINMVARQITERDRWDDAIEKAEKANILRWDYIRRILVSPDDSAGGSDGRSSAQAKQQRGGGRRPKVEYTAEEIAAAEERARKQLAQIAERRANKSKQSRPR